VASHINLAAKAASHTNKKGKNKPMKETFALTSDLIHNSTLKAVAGSPETLPLLVISIDLSEKDMREMIAAIMPVTDARNEGIYVTMFGYDDDPRELWQIPEARIVAQRWVNVGGLGVMNSDAHADPSKQPGFGTLQMWLLAQGLLGQSVSMSPETLECFCTDYLKGCAIANDIEAEFRENLGRHRAN